MPHPEPRRVASQVVYRLGADDRIIGVGAQWLAFARANGAPSLTPDAVCGRPVFDFVEGMEVRSIYRALFETVRARRRPVSIPLRCDSPDRRRLLRLDVRPVRDRELEIEGTLLRDEPRARAGGQGAALPAPRLLLELCSFCKRVAVPGRGWVELEDLGPAALALAAGRTPELRQSICEPCASELGLILDRALAA